MHRAFVITTSITTFLELFSCITSVICYLALSTGAEVCSQSNFDNKDGFYLFSKERVVVFCTFCIGLIGIFISLAMLVYLKTPSLGDAIAIICGVCVAAILVFVVVVIWKAAKFALATVVSYWYFFQLIAIQPVEDEEEMKKV